MRRHTKPLVVLAALATALVLTVTRRDAHRIGFGAGEPLRAAPSGDRRPYDLTALRVFNATLMRVNDSYVDPTRVDPKNMLLMALDQVQKSVAEVMVEPHPDQNKVVVRVDTQQKEFSIADVDSPWMLSTKMKDVFRFVSQNLQPGTDVREIEYAATNGMLQTLDPHSVVLDPLMYTEMKMSTKGSFGGLGMVLQLNKKGELTVVRPIPRTPASEAGVKAGDKIVRIEGESTANMMLNDAVSRLRGDPDTKIEFWTQRGDQPARRLVLTRAVVSVDSVKSKLLKGGISYVQLKQFSGGVADEMHRALDEMKSQGAVKGFILDLRGDPGGLLDQAIKVADEFVDSGTIVTTVGYANKQREEKRASPGVQPHVPMAVLVNGGSASASEIVAGALKNLDRAVIIGSKTFGKGSVQVLYDNDDGSALKLTIAQYLTPGDVSIQSVGIVPDIAIEPTLVSKERVSLFRQGHGMREEDLESHLTSRNIKSGDKPVETLRYLFDTGKKKPDKLAKSLLRDDDKQKDEAAAEEPPDDEDAEAIDSADDGEKFVEDYEITLARELLAQAHGWRRREVLTSSKGFFDKHVSDEKTKIADSLKKLGVEWSTADAATQTPARLEVAFTTDKPGNVVKAGETVNLQVSVTNRGPNVVEKARAITKCDDPYLEDREFVFGRLGPGETRTWSAPVKIDRAQLARLDQVKLEVYDDGGRKSGAGNLDLKIDAIPRPRFAYAYQLIDDVKGNGDGLVQRGESVRLRVTVKNVGEGKAYETLATLSSRSGDGVTVNKGRFDFPSLPPGESKTVEFTFVVTPEVQGDKATVQMDVYDTVLHEYVTDKLGFPLAPPSTVEPASGGLLVAAAQGVDVRAGASAGAAVIGHAGRGAAFPVTGKVGGFYRIDVEKGRPGYVAAAGTTLQQAAPAPALAQLTPSLQVVPPRLALDHPPLLADAATFRLQGTASDERQVADMYIFVSNRKAKIDHRKVFYRSNRKSGGPANQLRFDAVVPLWPGANQVTVVARQSNQVSAQQTLFVQRVEPPATAQAR